MMEAGHANEPHLEDRGDDDLAGPAGRLWRHRAIE
jgi:hypothetical protein